MNFIFFPMFFSTEFQLVKDLKFVGNFSQMRKLP